MSSRSKSHICDKPSGGTTMSNEYTFRIMFLVYFLLTLLIQDSHPCVSRNYGNGGTVCVCNSTYCDKIPEPVKVPPSTFLVYTSNLAGLRFQKSTGRFQPLEICESSINIDSTIKYQTIFGWGGAFTDATGINLRTLPAKAQENLLRSYFSNDGIEYNLGRVPIGGADFSTRPYTYDDGEPDPQLINFELQPEDYDYKIPYIRKAMNLTDNKLRLFGSAWTAPGWMKTNNNYSGYGFIQNCMYQPWANYYVKFLDEYRKCGVDFWGITTGNEPSDALFPRDNLEVVGWPSWAIGSWIRNNLGPTVKSAYPKTRIMILDDQRNFLPWYVEGALQDPITRQYINGIAVHWYLDQYFSPTLLSDTQKIFPEKFILSTEACNGFRSGEHNVLLGSWARGENYSADIIQDVLNWVIGWVDWNMALDLEGGPNYIRNYVDSPIIVNATCGEFYKQPMYYHLGHFSKFVPRGSQRIQMNFLNQDVDIVAFRRPDNGTAIILLNRNEKHVPLNIKDLSRGVAQVELSPRSITTLLYW